MRRASIFLSSAAGLVLLAGAHVGNVAGAAPAPTASPASERARVAITLRELDDLPSTPALCATLSSAAAPAADSSLRFESALVQTAMDIQVVPEEDELHENMYKKQLDDDVVALTEASTVGRSDLHGLTALADAATATELKAALLGLRDALDSAKVRQIDLNKQVVHIVGTMEGSSDPPVIAREWGRRNLVNLHYDESDMFGDLRTAAGHLAKAIALGGCSV